MRLWVDCCVDGVGLDPQIFALISAHPMLELVGLSAFGSQPGSAAQYVQRPDVREQLHDALVYVGPPDPRALDAAEAMLVAGPLTNMARLARHGIELPPMIVMESTFADDALSAAVVVNVASDLLVLPAAAATTVDAALFALIGEHVVLGKRWVGVGLDGVLMIGDDSQDFVERDLVIDCDVSGMQRHRNVLLGFS